MEKLYYKNSFLDAEIHYYLETLDLKKYLNEHFYMFSSDPIPVSIRIEKSGISDIIDIFGTDVTFSQETDNEVTVTAYADRMAILKYAKSYAPKAVIISPKSLADELKQELEEAVKAYNV